jgi:hypothetical protein
LQQAGEINAGRFRFRERPVLVDKQMTGRWATKDSDEYVYWPRYHLALGVAKPKVKRKRVWCQSHFVLGQR